MSNRRVVITGTGLITALGTGTEKNWQALLAGKSGVGPITRFDASGIDARIAGEVKDFVAEDWIDRREARRMDLFAQYALAAADMAMKESGLPVGADKPHGYDAEKVGVIVGSRHRRSRLARGAAQEGAGEGLRPAVAVLHPPDDHQHGARAWSPSATARKGPNWSPVSACSTSAHAIGEAVKSIRLGETDAMIAGGAEAAITPLGIGGFAAMKALSTRNDDPAARQPTVRQGPRRLRRGRGRGHRGARGAGARQAARREHPGRDRGLRRQLGRPPRDRARRPRARAPRGACGWRWRTRR